MGDFLTGAWTLPADHPRNPFKHKFHPDHDNLNARFDGPANESFDITRTMTLFPEAQPPNGPPVPDFGYHRLGGSYVETIAGLHKNNITLVGTFLLNRVSNETELNPNPNP
jgi:hypothetical protein